MTRLGSVSISRRKIGEIIDRARAPEAFRSHASGEDPAIPASLRDGLINMLDTLDRNSQEELLALAWFGREEALPAEWDDFLTDARQAWTGATAAYLAAMPKLATYLDYSLRALRIPSASSAEDACDGLVYARRDH